MLMECSYAVTAWTQAVEDEHRLLSQVLAILYAYPELPADVLAGAPRNGLADRFPIDGRASRSRKADGKADFWNAVGGQYKASLDYVVRRRVRVGQRARARPRGPDADDRACGTPTGRRHDHRDAPHRRHASPDADGEPLADAWVDAARRWAAGPSPTTTGASGSTACRPGAHRAAWRARPTAARPRRTVDVPGGQASTWSLDGEDDRTGNRQPDCPNGCLAASGRRTASREGWSMPVHELRPPRVLLGNLEPIVRLGMATRARARTASR